MKLEIEITEEEVRSAIERKLRVAIADYSNSYGVEQDIRERIKQYWSETVDKIIKEEVDSSEVMREKIQKALEAKIKAQLQAVIARTKV